MITNLKRSFLVAIAAAGTVVVLLSVWFAWTMHRFGVPTDQVATFIAVSAVGLILLVALHLRARDRWLAALEHDTRELERLVAEEPATTAKPVNGRIRTAELVPLSNRIREERRKLVDFGLTDYLCDTGNRRALEMWLRGYFADPRTRAPVSLLLLDIDHFKEINDRYGHQVGDRVIQGFAKALKDRIRRGDLIARLGGDEFCVVFPNTRLNVSAALSKRIRAQLPSHIELFTGRHHPVSWTGGLSVTDPFDESYDRVLWRADRAMIEAKAEGRNRTHILGPMPSVVAPLPDLASNRLH